MNKIGRTSFESWLRHPGNYQLIEKMAAGIYKKLQLRYLSIPGLDLNISDNPGEDIAQELLAFLAGDPSLMTGLQNKDPGSFVKISRYFFNHIIDRTRGKHDNQDIYRNRWRLFYRHAREVLDQSGRFVKHRTQSGLVCFSLVNSDPMLVVLDEDLPDVPFPEDITADFNQVNKKKSILRLALHYWEKCAKETREPAIRISVKTFTGWINRYVGLDTRIDSDSQLLCEETDGRPDRILENRIKDQQADIMKQKYLSTWAKNFSAILSEKEQQLFYFFECLGIKGKEISEKMGRKSNLNYHKNKIRTKLTEFLTPLEWISPDLSRSPDRRESKDFLFFMKVLCGQLSRTADPAV